MTGKGHYIFEFPAQWICVPHVLSCTNLPYLVQAYYEILSVRGPFQCCPQEREILLQANSLTLEKGTSLAY